MSDEGRQDYKLPGSNKANLALFWASNFFGAKDKPVIAKAETLLAEHGIGLTCWPENKSKSPDRVFDFGSGLITQEQYSSIYRTLSEVCEAANKREHLIILFCQFQFPANGLTISNGPMLCFRRPMVFVGATPGSDEVTLLHEMGHAAGMDHDRTSTGTTGRNFMNEAESRSSMMKWQVEKMGKSFFVS